MDLLFVLQLRTIQSGEGHLTVQQPPVNSHRSVALGVTAKGVNKGQDQYWMCLTINSNKIKG